MKLNPKKILIRLLLITFFVLVTARLAGFVLRFSYDSLQMDFAAYYTAGEALNEGLSPYKNHIVHNPPICDGRVFFKHSGFLYPPLVGTIFRPFALMPYLSAKFFWMILSLLCIYCALVTIAKVINFEKRTELLLIIYIFVCCFHPLLALLERGQIDAFTFLNMILGISFMVKNKKRQVFSGIFFAIATLLKLNCGFIILFLILRKKWRVIIGYAVGCLLIVLLSLAFNGVEINLDYLFNHAPRISHFGGLGTKEMMLPEDIMVKSLASTPQKMTIKDDILYNNKFFTFVGNATLVRTPFGRMLDKVLAIKNNPSLTSFAILLLFFIIMWLWQYYYRKQVRNFTVKQKVIYWHIVLVIILLASPFTWTMNVVWLLPIIIILLFEYPLMVSKYQVFYLYIGTMGLILAALPDNYSFLLLLPFGSGFLEYKYVIAEILLFFSLLCMLTYGLQKNISED